MVEEETNVVSLYNQFVICGHPPESVGIVFIYLSGQSKLNFLYCVNQDQESLLGLDLQLLNCREFMEKFASSKKWALPERIGFSRARGH